MPDNPISEADRDLERLGRPSGRGYQLTRPGGIRLWTGEVHDISLQARVFGVLVELASGRVREYRSDLYHDALWLQRNLTTAEVRAAGGEWAFSYAAEEWGTAIGFDEEMVSRRGGDVWRLTVRCDHPEGDGLWTLEGVEIGAGEGF